MNHVILYIMSANALVLAVVLVIQRSAYPGQSVGLDSMLVFTLGIFSVMAFHVANALKRQEARIERLENRSTQS